MLDDSNSAILDVIPWSRAVLGTDIPNTLSLSSFVSPFPCFVLPEVVIQENSSRSIHQVLEFVSLWSCCAVNAGFLWKLESNRWREKWMNSQLWSCYRWLCRYHQLCDDIVKEVLMFFHKETSGIMNDQIMLKTVGVGDRKVKGWWDSRMKF